MNVYDLKAKMATATAVADVAHKSPAWHEARKARLRDDSRIVNGSSADLRRRFFTFNAVCPIKLVPDAFSEPRKRPKRDRRPTVVADPLLAAWASLCRPPDGNTGAGSATDDEAGLFKTPGLLVHWLTASFPVEALLDVKSKLESLYGDGNETFKHFFGYRGECWVWESGAQLASEAGRGEATVNFPGGALDELQPEQVLAVFKFLVSIGAKFTRVDVAFDDYQRIVPIEVIKQNALVGNITGFKLVDPRKVVDVFSGEVKGESVVLGSRGKNGSGCFGRIYDKCMESGGLQDCIRHEYVYSKEKADAAGHVLAAAETLEEFARAIGGLVIGAVRFCMREGYEENVSRAPVLDWWQRIIDVIQGPIIRIKSGQLTARLQGAVEACKLQYGRTLALARDVLLSMGVQNFGAVVDAWCDGFKPKINWNKQNRRDLSLSLSTLLAT